MPIPVIFRKERSGPFKGDVTAVLPEYECYAHVGQHSTYSNEWYRSTVAATEAEYADLLKELQQIYEGELVVRKRRNRHDSFNA